MTHWSEQLNNFLVQANSKNLKTKSYPNSWMDLKMKVSFGQGNSARVPWISFLGSGMTTSKGIYPVYLYYKELKTLILAFGISETEEFGIEWPLEISDNNLRIVDFFDVKIPRYGDSYVYKSYKVNINNQKSFLNDFISNNPLSEEEIESDLSNLLNYYKKTTFSELPITQPKEISEGVMFMEKELENFIINNWKNTLGDKYDLIYEEGELISQQYKTGVGTIDILATDKKSGSYVVIELKKNQTTESTAGQIGKYLTWIKEEKKDENVKGIVIAGKSNNNLKYALAAISNTEFYSYNINFNLQEIALPKNEDNENSKLEKMLLQGEDKNQEFKSTWRYDEHQNKISKTELINAKLKTIAAFLNTNDGGILFIGVSDSGQPVGVNLEKEQLKNFDKLSIDINQTIHEAFKGSEYYDTKLVKIDSFLMNDKRIIRISVDSSKNLIGVILKNEKEERFFERIGPTTKEIPPKQLIQKAKNEI